MKKWPSPRSGRGTLIIVHGDVIIRNVKLNLHQMVCSFKYMKVYTYENVYVHRNPRYSLILCNAGSDAEQSLSACFP